MENKINDIIDGAKEKIDAHRETILKLQKTGKHTLVYTPTGVKKDPSEQAKKEVDAIKKEIGKIEEGARNDIREETKHLPEAEQKKYLDKLQQTLDAPPTKQKEKEPKEMTFGGSFGMGLPASFDKSAEKQIETDKQQSRFLKKDIGDKDK